MVKVLTALLIILSCCLLPLYEDNGVSARADDGYTAEFNAFLEKRGAAGPVDMRDSYGTYRFRLNEGRLTIIGTDKKEIWRSKDEWYVDSFRIGDVNRDRILDVAFVVWKSYSYGADYPDRMTNDDAAVRCHLFVYSVKDNRVKSLWCSSNLPRPIYSFEIDTDGERTPTLSGARIITREGIYTDDYSETASMEYTYEWNSWGFSPLTAHSNTADEWVTPQTSTPETYYATLAAVGDLMCHEAQYRNAFSKSGGTAYDFDYAFSHIAQFISSADYAIGNLETTIIPDGGNPSTYPRFGSPASFAEAIKSAGLDFVTTANNHALDFGIEGLVRTIQVLDDIGLEHTGTFMSEEESQTITFVNVNEITFAVLSYTYGTNGIPAPRDMPWCVNRTKKIKEDIARAKDMRPDFIIVLPHIGAEYETVTRERHKTEMLGLLEAGADIVLASHPHVLQPVEYVTVTDEDGTERTCFVAYSLGNFISSQRTAPCDYGMIINLNFSKTGGLATLDSIDLIPTWVKYRSSDGNYDITVLPVNELDKPEFFSVVKGLRREDVKRIEYIKCEFSSIFADIS